MAALLKLFGVDVRAGMKADEVEFKEFLDPTMRQIHRWETQTETTRARTDRGARFIIQERGYEREPAPPPSMTTKEWVYAGLDNLGRAQTAYVAGQAVWRWYKGN